MKLQRMLHLIAEDFRRDCPCRCDVCTTVMLVLDTAWPRMRGDDGEHSEAMLIVGTTLCLAAQSCMTAEERVKQIEHSAVMAGGLIRGALAREAAGDN